MKKYLFLIGFVGLCGEPIFSMDGGELLQGRYRFDYYRPVGLRFNRRNSYELPRLHSVFRRTSFAKRCGIGAPIYLAAVLQYLTEEILSLSDSYRRRMEIALGGFDIYQRDRWYKERANLEDLFDNKKRRIKEGMLRKEHEKKLRLRLAKCRKFGKSVSHQKRLHGKFGGKGRKSYR